MKALKIIGMAVASIIVFIVLLILVLDTDFFEARRLKGQIEINLGISVKKQPVLLYRENYGWAEEGGDKALLQMSNEDCTNVINVLVSEEPLAERSEYAPIFKKKGLSPKAVKTWYSINDNRGFTLYAMDSDSCILYRQYHYE